FQLSYDSQSPSTAQRVANELVSLYLAENLKQRQESATGASTFLSQEAEALQKRIATLEEQMAAFKEQNSGRLPELVGLNLQLMDRTENELRSVEQQIRSAEERRIMLQ